MRIRKRYIVGAALSGVALVGASGLVSQANASVLVSDTFTQPDGTNLLGTTPDIGGTVATQSGSTNPILIESDAAVVNEATGVQDDNVPFAGGGSVGAGNVVYASYTINVSAPTTLTPVYFGMFLSGTSNFTSRVWINTPTTPGDGFRVTLSQNSSATATGDVNTQDLAFGTTYTILTSYDYSNKDGSLWLGTTDPSATPIGTTSDTGFSDPVSAYAFRQSATAGNVSISVDNLNVSGVLPEPASLSLLGIGGLAIRRRSRKQ